MAMKIKLIDEKEGTFDFIDTTFTYLYSKEFLDSCIEVSVEDERKCIEYGADARYLKGKVVKFVPKQTDEEIVRETSYSKNVLNAAVVKTVDAVARVYGFESARELLVYVNIDGPYKVLADVFSVWETEVWKNVDAYLKTVNTPLDINFIKTKVTELVTPFEYVEGKTPPSKVTIRQAKLALLEKGLLSKVDELMKSDKADEAMKIEWEYATEVKRTWIENSGIKKLLGLTNKQLDELFLLASSK